MSGNTFDPMNDERTDRELRRFLEWDVEGITGAPTEADMIGRLERATRTQGGTRPALLRGSPTFRAVVVLGLLAALAAGAVAVGALLERNNQLVVVPTGGVRMTVAGTEVGGSPLGFTVDLPGSWSNTAVAANSVTDDPTAEIGFFVSVVDNTFTDPCAHTLRDPDVGSAASEVVAALAAIPGTTTTPPVPGTFAGYATTAFDILIPATLPCSNDQFYLWQDGPGATWWPSELNERVRVRIVEVAGYSIAVASRSFPRTSDAAKAELAGILSTIAFEAPQHIDGRDGPGPIDPGTYEVSDATLSRTPFRVTVPSGWTYDAGWFVKGNGDVDGLTFSSYVVTHVYENSCGEGPLVEVGTPDLLVAALAAEAGHDVSEPTPTTLGGLPATVLELSLPLEFDTAPCGNEFAHVWPDPGPDSSGGFPLHPGQTASVYVVDDEGTALVFLAMYTVESSPVDVAELEAVVRSVTLLPL